MRLYVFQIDALESTQICRFLPDQYIQSINMDEPQSDRRPYLRWASNITLQAISSTNLDTHQWLRDRWLNDLAEKKECILAFIAVEFGAVKDEPPPAEFIQNLSTNSDEHPNLHKAWKKWGSFGWSESFQVFIDMFGNIKVGVTVTQH